MKWILSAEYTAPDWLPDTSLRFCGPVRPWRRVESRRSLGLGPEATSASRCGPGSLRSLRGAGVAVPVLTWFLSASDTISNEF